MPWNLSDYPDSFKNFDHVVKKKAIDIANALLEEGYDNGQDIPIATKQAKVWPERADSTYATKEQALERAKEIAANKETSVIMFTKDGKRQD
ncbi:DUF2188 domain-containing protein [Alkalibacterium sp. 20]|uniref:DUF2188 domain-containing protein n=1 Tax=Alkalibacterium sp. 20 TaxID=1798803 RepID=UPI0009004E53|nr:DUF2188 domain-containing protein [Alkalibacterium sp. 20]OJF90922.1 hypothetical protein AX762_03895 [Alkalibacterium sp. 20]